LLMDKIFKQGDLVAYCPTNSEFYDEGDLIDKKIYKVDIGVFKRYADDYHAFIYFSTGETASRCSLEDIYPIENSYCILAHGLGGVEEKARECVAGKWDNGLKRRQSLEALGYDYEEVQERVNEIMSNEDKE